MATWTLRICQVSDGASTYPPIGAETRSWETHRISDGLSRLGNDVEVLLLPPALGMYRYKTHSLGWEAGNNKYFNKSILALYTLSKMRRYLERGGFDIVHFHSNVAAAAGIVGIKGRTPTVVTWGDPFLGGSRAPNRLKDTLRLEHPTGVLQRKVSLSVSSYTLHNSSAVIAVSETLRSRIVSLFGISRYKIQVIPPEVDTDRFKPGLDGNALRASWGIPRDSKVVMCPARITPLKSQIDLVRALPKVKAQFGSMKLFLVGNINSSDYLKKIMRVARQVGVVDSVRVTGTVSMNVFPLYYNMSNLVVLPSAAEGLPSSLLEAMSSARAILASDIPPNREVARDREVARYFEPHNIDELAEGVVTLLGDEHLSSSLGAIGRDVAIKYYNWKRIAELTANLYERLI